MESSSASDVADHTLGLTEAAAALGISPNTCRRWIKSGRLPAERVPRPQGYEYRLTADSVESARRAGARGQAPAVQPAPIAQQATPSADRSSGSIGQAADRVPPIQPPESPGQTDAVPVHDHVREQVTDEVTTQVIEARDATPELTALVSLLKEKDQQVMQLSGQVGFLQGQLQQAQETIRLLEAPQPQTAAAPQDSDSRPAPRQSSRWWHRLRPWRRKANQ